jgi:CYTH domain-containing protein
MSDPAGKYARFELERRFLVGGLPDGAGDGEGWRIHDRYIENTQLRLRRMEPAAGGDPVFKLGQKHVPAPPDFAEMTITNIYLSAREYDVFAVLPARELRKSRRLVEHEGRVFNVDTFEGELAGLVLAEVGFDTHAELSATFDLPPWVIREVSDDVRFTGGALAALRGDQARAFVQAAI